MSSNTNRKESSDFLVQGSILAIASIASRIIGLIYRMPLTAIIGDVGNSYYSCAFEIYNLMLLISSFSLPLAVSKLVSARVAKGEWKNAYKVVKCAFTFALIVGFLTAMIVFFGASFLTGLLKTPMSIYALRVLAPTLVIVAVLGVFRGFFQGLGTMMPSAFSQIAEQIVNAFVSVGAAYFLSKYGMKVGAELGDAEDYSAAFGAAGGTLGTGAGALMGLLFVLFVFFAYKKILKRNIRKDHVSSKEEYRDIFRVMFFTIVPVLVSTTIYNISSLLDQGIYKNVLYIQGVSAHDSDMWWGIFSGKYKTLINVPISIASSMASSSVPSLTAAFSAGKEREVRRQIDMSTRFVMVIAFPCAVGMGVLASPILQLLFGDSTKLAAQLMQLGAVSIVFYSLSTLSNGLLQGINRMKVPVRNAAIALVLHILLLLLLLYAFRLNIYAVVYANAFFALVMCLLNGYSVTKYSRYHPNYLKTYLVPAGSSLIMGVAVWLAYTLVMQIFNLNTVATCIAVLVGVVVYGIVMLLLKGLTEEELRRFPKGHQLVKMARKLHLLK